MSELLSIPSVLVKSRTVSLLFSYTLNIFVLFCQSPTPQKVAVLWKNTEVKGEIDVSYGRLSKLEVVDGQGVVNDNHFKFFTTQNIRLEMVFDEYNINRGSASTLVSIHIDQYPFSFFLRDISSEFPIYIPEYHVIVTRADDSRDFAEIRQTILDRQIKNKLKLISSEDETSFESAAALTREQTCPTWLGISRDIRIFEIHYAMKNVPASYEYIHPKYVAQPVRLEELDNQPAQYAFVVGRGQGPVLNSNRRLEEGILPILHTTLIDEDIKYHSICFASLEKSPLKLENVKGTHYLVADNYCSGHMFTESQKKLLEQKLAEFKMRDEETILFFRCVAKNKSSVPRYAWFKTLRPGRTTYSGFKWSFEPETGFSIYRNGKVFGISRLNGKPLPNEEMAVLLQPGESANFDFLLLHSPIPRQRAEQLARITFEEKYNECRQYWKTKLNAAPKISLPEKRIQEMMYAGLLHLDLVAYGNEPDGTIAPTIGRYAPIGTESSPIIQYFNSMGWHALAKRSLTYFLDKQHENGLIQNFGGYMVETGAALWSVGEYFRYTGDQEWIREIKPKLMKSCEFLIRWREENMTEDLKGKGYGMISGKVADPEDHFHQYMLNGYAYIGLKRVSEMLNNIDPEYAERLNKVAKAWKEDIRASLIRSIAESPVIPAGDGTWCPTLPPWTESKGPQALFADPGNVYTHGSFTSRDALIGPMYLIFCEVLDPMEEISDMILRYHTELLYQGNTAFSQPYYSRHDWVQLKKEMVKPFLKTYYTALSALADRETYTFWEHIYHASPHKTHEEAWFLMQTRWMLYMENKDTLNLFQGIPRNWLSDGNEIVLENMVSYFGPLSLKLNSDISAGQINVTITCNNNEKPSTVLLRIPHPDFKTARSVTGGIYNAKTETVKIESFNGKATVVLKF
ncbi:hypothetical protein ACFLSA_00730 [Bacteroidota bacterium]